VAERIASAKNLARMHQTRIQSPREDIAGRPSDYFFASRCKAQNTSWSAFCAFVAQHPRHRRSGVRTCKRPATPQPKAMAQFQRRLDDLGLHPPRPFTSANSAVDAAASAVSDP